MLINNVNSISHLQTDISKIIFSPVWKIVSNILTLSILNFNHDRLSNIAKLTDAAAIENFELVCADRKTKHCGNVKQRYFIRQYFWVLRVSLSDCLLLYEQSQDLSLKYFNDH